MKNIGRRTAMKVVSGAWSIFLLAWLVMLITPKVLGGPLPIEWSNVGAFYVGSSMIAWFVLLTIYVFCYNCRKCDEAVGFLISSVPRMWPAQNCPNCKAKMID